MNYGSFTLAFVSESQEDGFLTLDFLLQSTQVMQQIYHIYKLHINWLLSSTWLWIFDYIALCYRILSLSIPFVFCHHLIKFWKCRENFKVYFVCQYLIIIFLDIVEFWWKFLCLIDSSTILLSTFKAISNIENRLLSSDFLLAGWLRADDETLLLSFLATRLLCHQWDI